MAAFLFALMRTQTLDDTIRAGLEQFFRLHQFLDAARQKPIPHESYYANAGYFYLFGHYYAALCVDALPASDRPEYQAHLARTLLDLQEKDGSWWDYPFYDSHQPYGTAFALMSLYRCRAETAK